MTVEEIKKKVFSNKEYKFLRENEHLKDIAILGLGGSIAYGTNIETSDIDLRGCALPSAEDILCGNGFEQVQDSNTDTVIYSLPKFVNLCYNCNPNVIELLGLKPEHYLYVSNIGRELLNNADMFLSKKAIHSFGGYASAQLRRLNNKEVRDVEQSMQEKHILATISNMFYTFKEKYAEFDEDSLRLYVDKSEREDLDTEIFMDVTLKHYPLRDYKSMWNEMQTVVKEYGKIARRATIATERGKLAKHMMHLVRLYLMAFDILENGKVITYREKDHDFLMSIREGKYLDGNVVKPEFYEIIDELDNKLQALKTSTTLPEVPDKRRIDEFLKAVNYKIVVEQY